jgi:glycosyltransferase involved in cell wall biosynthesis
VRVLIVHNRYATAGGEESAVDNEIRALRESGADAHAFFAQTSVSVGAAIAAGQAPWAGGRQKNLETTLRRLRPDVLHVHNLYPLLSPRVFARAKEMGTHTVLTLHNFRPICLNGLFLTPKMEVCERCSPGRHGPGIIRGCYRGSRVQSAALAAHLLLAHWRKWYTAVDRFIAPSGFLRDRFVAHGFPAERIIIQPHALFDMPAREFTEPEPYVLYLGRLSEEKGIRWLTSLFQAPAAPVRLRVAGDGPLRAFVISRQSPQIEYLGSVSGRDKWELLGRAGALILPSECYENLPMAVIEANACGAPALMSGQGGMAELAEHSKNACYAPRDATSFWGRLNALIAQSAQPAFRQQLQLDARERYSRDRFVRDRLALYEGLLLSSARQ